MSECTLGEHDWGKPEGSFDNYHRCVKCGRFERLDQHEPFADHGISPQQLREKVEALEKRHEQALQMCAVDSNNIRDAIIVLRDRLDAALTRIEELEKRPQAAPHFPPPWQMDKP